MSHTAQKKTVVGICQYNLGPGPRHLLPARSFHPIIKIVDGSLVSLPSPSSFSAMWNFGSLLGLCLIVQIVSGLFLAMHYSCDITLAFERVRHISRDVNWGWFLRMAHANGARFFFICLYVHIARGLYYGSYNFKETWLVGVIILFLVIGTAFLGYVLPWGQISFWGATVITNLASAVPVIGGEIVTRLWGGFSVRNATLTRFFTLHFLLPFLLSAIRAAHLLFLHESGSSNPLGVNRNLDKSPFHPYFRIKDLAGFLVFFLAFFVHLSSGPLGPRRPGKLYPCSSYSNTCTYSTRVVLSFRLRYPSLNPKEAWGGASFGGINLNFGNYALLRGQPV